MSLSVVWRFFCRQRLAAVELRGDQRPRAVRRVVNIELAKVDMVNCSTLLLSITVVAHEELDALYEAQQRGHRRHGSSETDLRARSGLRSASFLGAHRRRGPEASRIRRA